MLTIDQKSDLTTRLEQLLIAYAPASDKNKALGQLREVLATVPVEAPAPPVEAAAEPVADPAPISSETHDLAGGAPASDSHD